MKTGAKQLANNKKWMPLHTAAKVVCRLRPDVPKVLLLLLEKGADVNARDGGGMTPLDIALAEDNGPATEILLQHNGQSNRYTSLNLNGT